MNALVLGDSIIRHCHTPKHADILSIRGATVDTLITRVKQNIINFSNYQLVIIHVGTNDVDNGNADLILPKLLELCSEIRNRQAFMQFIISAIIPRPKDFDTTDAIIKQVNRSIAGWCSRRMDFTFYPTYNTFQKFGWPDLRSEYWDTDNLHLADQGVKRLNLLLKSMVSMWKNGTLR